MASVRERLRAAASWPRVDSPVCPGPRRPTPRLPAGSLVGRGVTLRLYDDDPYLVEFEAHVLGRLIHEGHPALVLDRTAFYPEGGGQPWDRGLLGGVEVLAVTERGGQVLHVMAAPVDRDHVRGAVDPTRRRDHRQQHHGQHLLSRALLETAGARTESFHLGAEASTLDLDREITDTQLEAAETRTNEVIWEARPVRVRVVTRADAARLGVEPPDGVGECVRLIEAEGFDLQACGGTHPRSTAEVGVVAVVGRERHKGGVRIRFLCGHRVLAAVRTWTATLADLGSLLSTPPEGLFRGVEGLASRLSAALERADLLGERLVEAEARRLLATASGRPPVVVGVYPSWTPPDLRALASRLMDLAPCVALLGCRDRKAHIVLARSEGLPVDAAELLREPISQLEGRGGGRPDLAQGGGERTDRLEEALEAAAARVRALLGSR